MMIRRIAALLGLVAVVALAVTLLYRVYLHHAQSTPHAGESEGSVVRLDARPSDA